MNQTGMLHRAICTFHLLQIAMFSSSSDGDIKKNKSNLVVFFLPVQSSFEGERVGAYVTMTGDRAPPLESRGRHYQQHIGTAGAVTRPGWPETGAWPAGAIKTPSPPLSDGEMRQLRMSGPLLVRCRGWPWGGWKYSLIKTPSSPPRWFIGRIPPAPSLLRPPAAGAFLLRPEIIYISGLSHCRNFSPSLRRNVWKYLRRVWKYFVARTQLTKCFQILYTIEVYELWNMKRRVPVDVL